MPNPTPYGPPLVVPALGDASPKKWHRSTTLQGVLVLALSWFLARYLPAWGFTDADVAEGVETALEIVAAFMVIIGRVKARRSIAPLLTGTGAAFLFVLMLSGCVGGGDGPRLKGVGVTGAYDPTTGGITGGASFSFGAKPGVARRRVEHPDITGAFPSSPFTPAEQRLHLADDALRLAHQDGMTRLFGRGQFPNYEPAAPAFVPAP